MQIDEQKAVSRLLRDLHVAVAIDRDPRLSSPPDSTAVSVPMLSPALPPLRPIRPTLDISIELLANTRTVSVDSPTPPPNESTARLPTVIPIRWPENNDPVRPARKDKSLVEAAIRCPLEIPTACPLRALM